VYNRPILKQLSPETPGDQGSADEEETVVTKGRVEKENGQTTRSIYGDEQLALTFKLIMLGCLMCIADRLAKGK
jgi:hypothetical protein